MPSLTLYTTAGLAFASSITFAAPVSEQPGTYTDTLGLFKRSDGTQGNPRFAVFDIDNWPNLAELNCYIMLCLMGGNRVFQRQPTTQAGEAAFRDDGGVNEPFHDNGLSRYGTTRISGSTVSPEDFPWRSIQLQPGEHRYLTGAFQNEQSPQGAAIQQGYQAHYGGEVVGYNEWFSIEFLTENPLGTFCNALYQNPPDTSVCGNRKSTMFDKTMTGTAIASFVYYYIKSQGVYKKVGTKKRAIEDVEWEGIGSDDHSSADWTGVTPDARGNAQRNVDVRSDDDQSYGIGQADRPNINFAPAESKHKRGIVELDEAGAEVPSSVQGRANIYHDGSSQLDAVPESNTEKRGVVVELDEAGGELPGSKRRGIVELNEAGDEVPGSG